MLRDKMAKQFVRPPKEPDLAAIPCSAFSNQSQSVAVTQSGIPLRSLPQLHSAAPRPVTF